MLYKTDIKFEGRVFKIKLIKSEIVITLGTSRHEANITKSIAAHTHINQYKL